jgi:hypothetical protein
MATAGTAAVAAFALVTGAHALWTVNDAVAIPPFQIGAVTFSAQVVDDDGTRVSSDAGEPVAITLPGSEIIKVLEQNGLDPEPVFWRFRASGAAPGITGLSVDVAAGSQVASDGSGYDVSSGVAREGTVLAGSTIKIYPAGTGGDCSAVPATPPAAEGEPPRNIHVYADQPHVLQAPGANPAGREVEQDWCVAMRWNHDPDGQYVNDAQVTATGEDGTENGAMTRWQAAVAFPPALDPAGTYAGRGSVAAVGEDSTVSRDHDDWSAVLFPDPSGEPALTLLLDPSVTNLNPSVATGDTFVFASTS